MIVTLARETEAIPVSDGPLLKRRHTLLAAAVALASWAAWSVPVICWSEWFPLDYSRLITIADELMRHPLRFVSPYDQGSGRFFPFYWLVFAVQSYLFGAATWAYAFTLCAVMLAALWAVCWIVFKTTQRRDASLLLLPLLYLGTPVAENISTIGKAEPYLCLLLFGAIGLFVSQCSEPAGRWVALVRYVGIAATFALAIWMKETSVALLGFCVAGLALAIGGWLLVKEQVWRDCARDYVSLLQSLLCGIGVAKAPYFLFTDTSRNINYTEYEITPELIIDNAYFYLIQQPDVLLFGLMSSALLSVIGWNLSRQRATDRSTAQGFVLFAAMVSMGWAYYGVLLIWRWPMSYYMLLPSCVFRAATVYGVVQLTAQSDVRWPKRAVATVITVTAVYGAAYAWYMIGSQIGYSRIYTRVLQEASERVPREGRLYLESYPFYSEQWGGTTMWLKAMHRPDIDVRGIADYLDPAVPTPQICKLLHVTDEALATNRKRIPTRGDYLVTFTGLKLATWMLRGVTPYACQQSLLAGHQGDFDLELVAEESIVQDAVYPHVWTGLPTAGPTAIGYKMYRVLSEKPRFLWFDRFPDGWVGSKASIVINSSTPVRAMLRISAPPFTLPNHVQIHCDGGPTIEVFLIDTNEVLLPIDCACPDGTSTITFRVDRVASPRDLKINKDKRRLGIRAACELAPLTNDNSFVPVAHPEGK